MAITYTLNSVEGSGANSIPSGSLTVATNDVIAVLFSHEDNGSAGTLGISKTAGTSTVSAFTNIATTNTVNQCKSAAWYCTVTAGGTCTITVTHGNNPRQRVLYSYVITGADTSDPCPVGNRFSGIDTNGDTTQSITPTASGSMLLFIAGDWVPTNSYVAAANCTIEDSYHAAGNATFCLVRPTTQPRTDANAFTIGESDTGATNAWVAFEIKAASGAVSVNLTGQAITSSQGSLTKSLNKTLTGQAITSSIGTITPVTAFTLIGQSVATQQGSFTVASNKTLTGQSITSTQGSLTPVLSQALTGLAITSSLGSFTALIDKVLSGQEIISAIGTITVEGAGDVIVNLTGQQITSSLGSFAIAIDKSLAGQVITSGQGSFALLTDKSLTGQSITGQQGSFSLSTAKALTGQSALVQIGSLVPQTAKSLTGLAITSSQGSFTKSINKVLQSLNIVCSIGTITVEGAPPGDTPIRFQAQHFIYKKGKIKKNPLRYTRFIR